MLFRFFQGIAGGANALEAKQQAYMNLNGLLAKQAYLATYVDVFMTLGVFFLICIPIVFLIKRVKTQAVPGSVSVH